MKVHELKTWPGPYDDVAMGRKRFEMRKFDRGYQSGDIVILREFIPDDESVIRKYADEHETRLDDVKTGYTGRWQGPFRIGYLCVSQCLPEGWCGFSLVKLSPVRSE